MIGTACVADKCPVKEKCVRYVIQRTRRIRWFINPTELEYTPNGCKEFVSNE